MIITNKLISLFQGLKSIYNGIYKSIFFTYVDSNKILNINTLLLCLLRGKKQKMKYIEKSLTPFFELWPRTSPNQNWTNIVAMFLHCNCLPMAAAQKSFRSPLNRHIQLWLAVIKLKQNIKPIEIANDMFCPCIRPGIPYRSYTGLFFA